MISYTELLHGHVVTDLTIAEQHCLEMLQTKMNIVREAYGKPMTVTSGFRTPYDQARINPKVTRSAHMEGKACDIYDPTGELHAWCKENESLLRELGLFLENRQGNWQHFQTRPFASYKDGGSIWFNP